MGIERRGKDTDSGNVSLSLCSEGEERNGLQARGWLEVKVACLRGKFENKVLLSPDDPAEVEGRE